MKRYYLLFISLIMSIVMMAGDVTSEQAEQLARQFLTKHRPATKSQRMRMASRKQLPMTAAHDGAAYYVFNVGDNNGFVMVSGDDRTPAILGYTDKGAFNDKELPSHMKAWFDGYADQIAYLKRTDGRYEAPRLRGGFTPIAPLIQSTWGQGAPYNDLCPTHPTTGERTVTGCVATALAQVINYHKYPSQTKAPIPAYTTKDLKISIPQTDITTIDWDNMLNSYNGTETAAQKNAVATLMALCGQATKMNYNVKAVGGSGTDGTLDVPALQKYFGFDKTVQAIYRNSFSTAEWEETIYNELKAGRPVLYGGSSTSGGHAFIVDGYDDNGLFHINWGWNGNDDHYFLLSVLNPYNNTAIGSNSSDDGFSFGQEAMIGIQHGTNETVSQRLSIYDMWVENESKTFTRTAKTEDFTGIKIASQIYNMSGDSHGFYFGLVLYDNNGEELGLLTSVDCETLDYGFGGTYILDNIAFGADMEDGEYKIVAICQEYNTEDGEFCWGSNFYQIKATISGNTLTLTEPTKNLTATMAAQGSAIVNKTVTIQAQITNHGTDWNDYVFLFVDNVNVGGRIFEAAAGSTETFDIDFMPTIAGKKNLTLAYQDIKGQYIPFAQGEVTIAGDETVRSLVYTIKVMNATEKVVAGNTAKIRVHVTNNGMDYNDQTRLALCVKNQETGLWDVVKNKKKTLVLASGATTDIDFELDELENQYYLAAFYYKDSDDNWKYERVYAYFTVDTEAPVDNSLTVAQALDIINGMNNGDITTDEYTVKGIVTGYNYSAQYKNISFYLADAADATDKLYVYRANKFNDAEILFCMLRTGDKVVVKGKLQKYYNETSQKVTPEITTGGTILSVNGATAMDVPEPISVSVAEAIEVGSTLQPGYHKTREYKVHGYVVGTPTLFQKNGNADLYIADERGGSPTLYIYHVVGLNREDIGTTTYVEENDEVVIQGYLNNYQGTLELSNGYMVSLTKAPEETTLNTVHGDDASQAIIYALDGRKLSNMNATDLQRLSKGIYIVNGRKIIRK